MTADSVLNAACQAEGVRGWRIARLPPGDPPGVAWQRGGAGSLCRPSALGAGCVKGGDPVFAWIGTRL